MTLEAYISAHGMTNTEFAKLIPCSYSYPGMIIRGKAKPGFQMACRIESVTGGLVPRTNWYPEAEKLKEQEAEI